MTGPETSKQSSTGVIATIAFGVGMLGLGEVIFASSVLYGGAALLVAILGFTLGCIALRWGRKPDIAAPMNTQLQQPPPAIIKSAQKER